MANQLVFSVSTAPLDPQGSVNCSPKGNRDEFAVLDECRVAFLDQRGSGVETIAYLLRTLGPLSRFAPSRARCG